MAVDAGMLEIAAGHCVCTESSTGGENKWTVHLCEAAKREHALRKKNLLSLLMESLPVLCFYISSIVFTTHFAFAFFLLALFYFSLQTKPQMKFWKQ